LLGLRLYIELGIILKSNYGRVRLIVRVRGSIICRGTLGLRLGYEFDSRLRLELRLGLGF
jgi:hypothetical protein